MRLKSLPETDRPRERLARYGTEPLSSSELLAILLGSGTKNRSVLLLAQDLLGTFGSLRALSEASLQELKAVKGIGTAKALQLMAVSAMAARIACEKTRPARETGVDNAKDVFEMLQSELGSRKVEMLMVLLCNAKRKLIHREIIGQGTLTELVLHPREVFHTAIRHRAHSVVIAHNHPSGDPDPSPADCETTALLVRAGRVVGIEVYDHIIVGKKSYVSFREKGLIR